MTRILMIGPFLSGDPRVAFTQEHYGGNGVDVSGIGRGPEFPATFADLEYCIEGVIERAVQGEKEGYDAIVVGCYGDPGVEGARQKVKIPVIGVAQASFALANMLGHRFTIVTVQKDFIAHMDNMVRIAGLRDKMASIRVYTCNITEMDPNSIRDLGCGLEPTNERDAQLAVEATIKDSIAAIEQDGASVVIFGCLGMSWMVDKAQAALIERGYKVPLIEPGRAGLAFARAICDLKLSHTRVMYPYG